MTRLEDQEKALFAQTTTPYYASPRVVELQSIQGTQFVCKGKHQYREVVKDSVSTWVCQCGRKL